MRLVVAIVLAGCGNTVDYLGFAPDSEGIDTLPQGSSTGSSTNETTSGTSTSSTSTGSSSAADGPGSSSSSSGATCGDPCARLDMLVVLDNTDANADVRSGLVMNTQALAQVVADPARRWVDDFRVGIVPTNDGGTLAQCRVTGAMSATPRDGQPIPCVSASGANWANQDDAALALVLQCMANLEPVGPPDPPRSIALAAARGLGVAVASDPMAAQVIAACNDGFTRDDSLKVVTIIAADDDADSPGTPTDWASWMAMVDADPCSPLVVVAAVPSNPLTCSPVAEDVASWTMMVDIGATSDWCAFRSTQGASGLQDLGEILDEVCG